MWCVEIFSWMQNKEMGVIELLVDQCKMPI